ncbi:MAG: alpha/beta fold hydrolase, partial [Alphaproteobacteria bacterium]|nr:alpha/beta fold hydrolase [Alphaproteobacteria bacterium]
LVAGLAALLAAISWAAAFLPDVRYGSVSMATGAVSPPPAASIGLALPMATSAFGLPLWWADNRAVIAGLGAALIALALWGQPGRRRAAALVVALAGPGLAMAALPADGQCRGWLLTRCEGQVEVAWNRDAPAHGVLSVGYVWVPRGDILRPSAGVIAPNIGGPAASTAFAGLFRDEIFPHNRLSHDLLIFDYRGFGRSAPLICETDSLTDITPAQAKSCADRLGVRANDLSAAAAADDLAAVMDAMGIARATIYGFSYGTYFTQAFGLKHPARVEALVLDSPLWLAQPDFAIAGPRLIGWSMRQLQDLCRAEPSCRALGDPAAIWSRLVADVRLRRDPAATVDDLIRFSMHPFDPVLSGRFFPAAVSWLGGDRQPLRTLVAAHREEMAELADDSGDPNAGVTRMNALLVSSAAMPYACNDYAMPFDRRAPQAERSRQFAAASMALDDSDFAPFTKAEVTSLLRRMSDGTVGLVTYGGCQYWPAPVRDARADLLARTPANIPVLVLSGALDETTTPEMAEQVARAWPNATLVRLPYLDHWVAYQSACVRRMIAGFIDSRRPPTTGCRGPKLNMRPV